ncbi:MAG: competence/damage-inducible protein A [Chthoniobacterales bacterium]
MQAEVINTGSELLLGLVQNTHLAWLAGELAPPARADLVICTGGLGPTTDDITREVAADLLGLPLVEDRSISDAIRARFARRGLPMAGRVVRQAMVPVGADALPNPNGTAPGLYFPPPCSVPAARGTTFFCPGRRGSCNR